MRNFHAVLLRICLISLDIVYSLFMWLEGQTFNRFLCSIIYNSWRYLDVNKVYYITKLIFAVLILRFVSDRHVPTVRLAGASTY